MIGPKHMPPKKKFGVMAAFLITLLTVFMAGMLQTRVALFHMHASGRWDDGAPYLF